MGPSKGARATYKPLANLRDEGDPVQSRDSPCQIHHISWRRLWASDTGKAKVPDNESINNNDAPQKQGEYSLKAEGTKAKGEVRRKSPKRARVWDRLQKPKDKEPLKRQRASSPRREDGRQRRPQEQTFYTPLRHRGGTLPRQNLDSDKDNDVAPRITGRFDTISGGIAGGGDTSNARRRCARRY
ncbi:hypothetical protein LIER_42905 [Lithospermum erythrorhizon]|uniref:Uncharacterized protein n=1 Tax=Lithospermum erythrorhizon TaxID=34254 RepID=A0AAV3P6R6_LITER